MLPEVIVTNFKRRITGVTTTALRVTQKQRNVSDFSLGLCGPNQPLSLNKVLWNGWTKPSSGNSRIWHVRRNNEMIWGLIARDLLRQPIKLVFTSAAIRKHSAFPRWLISRMNAVIATSDAAASFVPHVKAVVGHGVDVETFCPNPHRCTDTLTLISVGRIRSEKGTDLIVDALCQLLPNHPNVRMQFVGLVKPADQAFYQKQLNKLEAAGIASQVEWLGEVSPSQMPRLISSAHMLIAAPTYEGFGLTPFEALACGTTIVCTDTGAFASATGVDDSGAWFDGQVKRGSTGLLINTGDTAALTDALELLVRNKKVRETLADEGLKRAQQHFTLEAEARDIDAVYKAL